MIADAGEKTDGDGKPEARPKNSSAQRAVRKEDAEFIRNLIIYQDDDVIALNKPFGLAVQGGTGTARHIDGMLAALEKNGDRPRLVHRLDRDTSGLLVLAANRIAAAKLGAGSSSTKWRRPIGRLQRHAAAERRHHRSANCKAPLRRRWA